MCGCTTRAGAATTFAGRRYRSTFDAGQNEAAKACSFRKLAAFDAMMPGGRLAPSATTKQGDVMHIKVSFPFQAAYIPPRMRVTRTETFVGETYIDIDQLPGTAGQPGTISAAAFAQEAASGGPTAHDLLGIAPATPWPTKRIDAVEVTRIVRSNHAEVVARIREHAAKLAICGGAVYNSADVTLAPAHPHAQALKAPPAPAMAI